MTIITTRLGPNTNQITIASELNSDAFVVALDAAIVAGGWVQHDVSNPLYRVYKAINLDGVSYKYASVSIDVYRQRFWLSCWESWNAATHVGTNEAFTVHGGYWQPYTFNNCEVVVFASLRWLGFQTYIRNVPAPHPVFVQETTRDHVQDTAAGGVPCWGWMTPSATSISAPFNQGTNGTNIFSTPRNKAGNTGRLAAQRSFIATEVARICSPALAVNGTVTAFGTGLSAAANIASGDVWDTNSRYAQTLRVGHGYSEVQGRMAGLKATKIPSAGLMNRVTVPVNSEFIYDGAGTPTEHWVLPINSEYPAATSVGAIAIGAGFGQVYDAVWDGVTLFMSRAGGFQRYNLEMGVLGPIIPATTGNTANMGFVFDGRNIYFAAGDRIGKWDTTTDVVTYSVAVTGATFRRLCFNGTHLWAIDTYAGTSTFAMRKFDTSLALLATVSKTQVGCLYVYDIVCDNSGNMVFLVGYPNQANTVKLVKVNPADGVTIGTSATLPVGYSGAALDWAGTAGIFNTVLSSPANGYPGSGNYATFDATATTPVGTLLLSGNITATSIGTPVAAFGAYSGYYRYGRLAATTGISINNMCLLDYEAVNGSDSVITAMSSTSGWPNLHFGTHILSLNATLAVLTPLSGMTTAAAGGQLLLPK